MPARGLDQPTTEDRATDGAEQHRDSENCHDATDAVRTGGPGHDGHTERHQHAAAEALEHTEADERGDVPRHRTGDRTEHEQHQGRHVEALGAETVGSPTGNRNDRRQSEGVGRHRPRDGGVRSFEVLGKSGERDAHHGYVENRHDGAEHHHGSDLEDRPVKFVGRRCRRVRRCHREVSWLSARR